MRVLVLAVLVFGAIATEEEEDAEASGSEEAECPDLAEGCTTCADVIEKCSGGLDGDDDFEPAEDDAAACEAATAAVAAAIAEAGGEEEEEEEEEAAAVWACTPPTDGADTPTDLDTQELCEAFWATPATNGVWDAGTAASCNAAEGTCGAGNDEPCTADNCADQSTCDDAGTPDDVETDAACVWDAGTAASCDPATDGADAPTDLDTEELCTAHVVEAGSGQGVWAEVEDRRRRLCDDDCLAEFVGDCDEAAAIECMTQWAEFGEDCADTWAEAAEEDEEAPAAMLSLGAAVLLMFL